MQSNDSDDNNNDDNINNNNNNNQRLEHTIDPISEVDEDLDDPSHLLDSTTATTTATANTMMIPDWIDEFTTIPQNNLQQPPSPSTPITTTTTTTTSKPHSTKTTPTTTTTSSPASFPSLSYDAASQILLHLSLHELLSFSTISRQCREVSFGNDVLWKIKFEQRWNCRVEQAGLPEPVYTVFEDVVVGEGNDGCGEVGDGVPLNGVGDYPMNKEHFWRLCYKNALTNPHDLWVTHWNCILPIDGVSSGRTVVPDLALVPRPVVVGVGQQSSSSLSSATVVTSEEEVGKENCGGVVESDGYRSSIQDRCPTCRHHPLLQHHREGASLEEIEMALEEEVRFSHVDNDNNNNTKSGVVGDAAGEDNNAKDNGTTTTTVTTRMEDPIRKAERKSAAHAILCTNERGGDGGAGGEGKVPAFVLNSTPARAIYHATQYSLSKWGRYLRTEHNLDLTSRRHRLPQPPPPIEPKKSNTTTKRRHKRTKQPQTPPPPSSSVTPQQNYIAHQRQTSINAFQNASTFYRTLNTDQYRSSGLNFLTDVLFLPIQPSHEKLEVLDFEGQRQNREVEAIVPEQEEYGLQQTRGEEVEGVVGGIGGEARGVGDGGDGSTRVRSTLPSFSCKRTERDHALLDVYGRPPPPYDPLDETKENNNNNNSNKDTNNNNNNNNNNSDKDDDDYNEEEVVCDYPLHAHRPGTLASLGPGMETARHSWHMMRLTNPDYVRPITFRVYIQRPDCFTASPASGFLLPGQTTHLTLGVRALGSLMAESFHDMNIHREEADPISNDIFASEGYLPHNAFCIRYMYCPSIPCIPHELKGRMSFSAETGAMDGDIMMGGGGFVVGGGNNVMPAYHHLMDGFHQNMLREERGRGVAIGVGAMRNHMDGEVEDGRANTTNTTSGTTTMAGNSCGHGGGGLLDHLWDNITSEAEVRAIHLSAHVSGNYPFDEFQNHTITPFEQRRHYYTDDDEEEEEDDSCGGYDNNDDYRSIDKPYRPTILTSPDLQTHDPSLHAWLNNDIVHASAIGSGAGGGYCGQAATYSTKSSPYGTAVTENCCACCGNGWDARAEFLGRSFVLRKAVCEGYARLKSRQMERVVVCLKSVMGLCYGGGCLDGVVVEAVAMALGDGDSDDTNDGDDDSIPLDRIYQLLYYIHQTLLNRRGDRSLSLSQKDALRSFEIIENLLSLEVGAALLRMKAIKGDNSSSNRISPVMGGRGGGDMDGTSLPRSCVSEVPWRDSGIYHSLTCTDSHILSKKNHTLRSTTAVATTVSSSSQTLPSHIIKEEPIYLTPFRNLHHSPGLYSLGKLEDNNHLDDYHINNNAPDDNTKTEPFQNNNHYYNTDLFKDNAFRRLSCTLAMIHDPRSLLGQGIYDRVPEPGTVIRCHLLESYECFQSTESTSRSTPLARRRRCELLYRLATDTIRGWETSMMVPRGGGGRQRPTTGRCPDAMVRQRRLKRPERRILPFSINDPDSDGLLLAFAQRPGLHIHCHVSSLSRFIRSVPPPGVGRFSLSAARRAPVGNTNAAPREDGTVRVNTNTNGNANNADSNTIVTSSSSSYVIVPLDLHTGAHLALPQRPNNGTTSSTDGTTTLTNNDPSNNNRNNPQRPRNNPQLPPLHDRPPPPPFIPMGHIGGLRLFNSLWTVCEQLGWSCVEDEVNPGQIMVDRRMMTSVQWLSNSLMIFPLLWTLFARWYSWISPYPLEYNYSGLPYAPTKQMRYLQSGECGIAAILFILMWLALGRYAERQICRTYDRSMVDFFGINRVEEESTTHNNNTTITTTTNRMKTSFASFLLWCQRRWDYICPISIQQLLFTPHWNRRSVHRIKRHIISARSNDQREWCRSTFSAHQGRYKGDRILSRKQQLPGFMSRMTVCLFVGGGSFSASSPHYILNLCTIFSCSISMGLSMSLNYMEISRTPRSISVLSKFRHMRFEVFVTMFFLVGQLVGSSGGILFLAEFVVTTVGLLLGGAATISTNAFESWVCFFCLSSTAFWGYLLARVSLANGVRQNKQGCCPSLLLMISFFVFLVLWIASTLLCEWELPTTIMIVHPSWRPFYTMEDHNSNMYLSDDNERLDDYRNLLP